MRRFTNDYVHILLVLYCSCLLSWDEISRLAREVLVLHNGINYLFFQFFSHKVPFHKYCHIYRKSQMSWQESALALLTQLQISIVSTFFCGNYIYRYVILCLNGFTSVLSWSLPALTCIAFVFSSPLILCWFIWMLYMKISHRYIYLRVYRSHC